MSKFSQHAWFIPFLALVAWLLAPAIGMAKASAPRMPELNVPAADDWINSPPLTLAGLRGQPVLIEFWTFDCRNCRRSVSWVNSVHRRFPELTVIGVHTPEFSHERKVERVRDKVDAFGIRHPVVLDNDMRYWNAVGNRYWPAFYLVDRDGRVQGAWAGEILEGSERAHEVEARIRQELVVDQ